MDAGCLAHCETSTAECMPKFLSNDGDASMNRSAPLIVTSLLILSLFGLAYAAPIAFWGINFQTYLSPIIGIVAALGMASLAYGLQMAKPLAAHASKVPNWVWAILAASAMGLIFYSFNIATDLYGDSRVILNSLGKGGVAADRYNLLGAFSPNIFSAKNGEQFTYSLAMGFSKLLGITVQASFRLLSTVCGILWVMAWVAFVLRHLETAQARLVGILVGLTAGITQVFYGHVEVYAAPILAITLYLMALVEWLDGRKRLWLIAVTALLLLAIRSHSAGFALLPTYIFAVAAPWAGSDARRLAWLSLRRLGWILPAVALLLGMTAYMTVFHAGAEVGTGAAVSRNPFLTPFGDKNIDNGYFLFAPWHLWDFVQEMLLGSAAGCALLLSWAWYRLRKGPWGSPAEVAVSMALLLLTGLIFVIDPALTMSRDWDLCGLAAPALLMLALLFLKRMEAQERINSLAVALLLGIAGFQATFVALNHQPKPLHLRLIDMGTHAFVSGHGGSSFIVKHALGHACFSAPERIDLARKTLAQWNKHLNRRNHPEHSFLCIILAGLEFEANNFEAALANYTLALGGVPDDARIYEDLAVTNSRLGRWDATLSTAIKAINLHSQNPFAWRLAMVSAQQLGQLPLALQVGRDFLNRFGDQDGLSAEVAAMEQQLAGANAVPQGQVQQ
jgi:tetratricopeptide (TPR) repeat protein